MGEAVRAVVQLAGGEAEVGHEAAAAAELIAQELIDLCRQKLAHYKCPSTVAFVEAVPRIPTGKLAKRLLDDWVREPFPAG